MTPLERWLREQGNVDAPVLDSKTAGVTPVDPIVLSHWIVFGVRPTKADEVFWAKTLGTQSVYNLIMGMHQSSLPSVQIRWRWFYRLVGVGGPHSPRALTSPTMTAVRVYLRNGVGEPDPKIILTYLKALLRRPSSLGSFEWHVERHVNRQMRSLDDKGPDRRKKGEGTISTEVVQMEILALVSILGTLSDTVDIRLFSRALSPVPASQAGTESPSRPDQGFCSDDVLSRLDVDQAAMERRIVPLLPLPEELPSLDQISRVEAALAEGLVGDEGEGFVVLLYRIILGRDPDSGGYHRYLDALRTGELKPPDVIGEFLRSDEFRSKRRVAGGGHISLSAPSSVGSAWEALIPEGIGHSTELIQSAVDPAAIERDIATLLPAPGTPLSETNLGKISAILTDASASDRHDLFVMLLYKGVLHRKADLDGYNHYLGDLNAGIFDRTEVIAQVIASEEFKAKHGHKRE